MLTAGVVDVLDDRLACPQCQATGRWALLGRPVVRQNSSIYHFRCTQCGDQIAAKVSGGRTADSGERVLLRREYAALRELESAFPHDCAYGTLEPIDCFQTAGSTIMVTRWFAGSDLATYARGLDSARADTLWLSAGSWLRKLHAADNRALPPRPVGTVEKIEDLRRAYGPALAMRDLTRAACELLMRTGDQVDTIMVRPARLHGDFKAQNLLCNGSRYVGLDIQWSVTAAVVYDLAPFLNHLWLQGPCVQGRYARVEERFLAGYCDTVARGALRWAQLYFALCHMGRYRQRGIVAASYANWKVGPLVQRIADELRAVT